MFQQNLTRVVALHDIPCSSVIEHPTGVRKVTGSKPSGTQEFLSIPHDLDCKTKKCVCNKTARCSELKLFNCTLTRP